MSYKYRTFKFTFKLVCPPRWTVSNFILSQQPVYPSLCDMKTENASLIFN